MANEKRLIDANALETRMGNLCDEFGTDHLFIDAIIYEIGTAPTVDAAPVVHGRWEYYSTTMMECSVCKRHTARHRYKYCPHCGAVMEDKFYGKTD